MWSEMTIGLILIGMHYLIYKITNRLDNKIYVGKHKTEDKNDDYFGSGLLLGRAVEKHGKEHFTKEILMECQSEEEMNQRELDIVDEDFVARDDTYNIKLGGQGGFDYINENELNKTEDAIEKHRLACIPTIVKARNTYLWMLENDLDFRREVSEKHRIRLTTRQMLSGNLFRGKHHSVESKLKMKRAKAGKYFGKENPVFGKHWVTNGTENKMVDKNVIPIGWKKGRV